VSESLVLCYHAVSPTWAAPLSVTPDALERQLSWFLRHGWRGSTFSDAVLQPPTARALAVTFDDAFASVFALAYPIVQSLGLIGTVFAPTSFMSARQRLSWPGIENWAATPDASELESMSWTEIDALSDDGWEIGSHTRSHPFLTRLDDAALREELTLSREDVTRQVGRPCRSIAYPSGDVDQRVADLAGDAGYLAGAALSRRLTPLGPLRWPRIGIYHDDHWQRFRIKASRPVRRLRGTGRPLPRGV
jgi:peptidoglycan/xylan/chitin deacetylase (PgdA/CDA1 family)